MQILETFLAFLKTIAGLLRANAGVDIGFLAAGGLSVGLIAWVLARRRYGKAKRSPPGGAVGKTAQKAVPGPSLEEEKYRVIFDNSPFATFICDSRHFACIDANRTAVNQYGYSREEFLGKTIMDFGAPEDAERLMQTLLGQASISSNLGTWHHRKKDGKPIDVELVSFRAQFAGRPARIVVAMDVTLRKRAEETLGKDIERFEFAWQATRDAMWDWDLTTHQLWRNDGFFNLFGYRREDLATNIESWLDQIHQDDRVRVHERILEVINSAELHWSDEFRFLRANKTVAYTYARGFVVRAEDGTGLRMIGVIQDITTRKEAEQQARFLADHDELTKLPNRASFKQTIDQALLRAERNNRLLAVMFVDLDRFKNINDSLGHDAGDEVLRVISERLIACVRQTDFVARFGGDEFAVLLEGLVSDNQAGTVGRKMLDSLSKPIMLGGGAYRITASIGISMYPTDGRDSQSLQKNADIAMYRSKEQGKSTYQFYSEQANVHSIERLMFESHLNSALEKKEFVLHYQPKVDIKSGRVTGVEALVRWISPQFGQVPPIKFIPIAEETGLIVPLGRWILQTACAQNRAWQQAGLPFLRIAVNLSPRQLADKGLVDMISETMRSTGLSAESLEVEITESTVMNNQEYAGKQLNQIKALGIHLTMDDFGTGYSSLAYLKRFPFDTVKIDRSFVMEIPDNKDDSAIVAAIIAMAHTLQLKVVAEGVETKEQFEYLRDLKCDQIQGYYFGKPLTSSEVVHLLYKTTPQGAAVQPAS